MRGTVDGAQGRSTNSADSQFFIMFADGFFDGQYTVMGKVVDGMDIVDKLKRGEPVRDADQIVRMRVAADAE